MGCGVDYVWIRFVTMTARLTSCDYVTAVFMVRVHFVISESSVLSEVSDYSEGQASGKSSPFCSLVYFYHVDI